MEWIIGLSLVIIKVCIVMMGLVMVGDGFVRFLENLRQGQECVVVD